MQLGFDKSARLVEIFSIELENEKLFQNALTHGSFSGDCGENYERLEFLGDAVLKLCVSDILYKKFPEYAEGDLTKIRSIVVSDSVLADVAQKIGLGEIIFLGKSEERKNLRPSILACCFEAVLGAYFLENKLEEISQFLTKALEDDIEKVDKNFEKFNAKAILQEYTQAQTHTTPSYQIVGQSGPEHDKVFEVEVSYQEEVLSNGFGKTKREAEQNCAYEACKKLGAIQ